jgi:transposase
MEKGEFYMGRKAIEVSTLHGFTLDELVKLKNTHESQYAQIILTVIIMRYNGKSPKEIIEFTGKSNVTIVSYIKKWNKLGIKCLKDHRHGTKGTFTAEMEYDLIQTALKTTPNECGFSAHRWTCSLLSQYIENNYGIKYSIAWINIVLKRNNLSYKRAQAKPTKASKEEQERFKKNVSNTRFFRSFR